MYIDDITAIHLSSGSILNLYADDMLLYKAISSQSDYQSLQDDVDRVQEWVNVNYLTLNASKCKTMVVSRRRNQHVTQLQLGNDVVVVVVLDFNFRQVIPSAIYRLLSQGVLHTNRLYTTTRKGKKEKGTSTITTILIQAQLY